MGQLSMQAGCNLNCFGKSFTSPELWKNIFGRVAGKILGGRKVALLGAVGDDAEGAQYRHDDGVGGDDDGDGGENDDGGVGEDDDGAGRENGCEFGDDGVGDDDTIMVCTVGLFLPQRR